MVCVQGISQLGLEEYDKLYGMLAEQLLSRTELMRKLFDPPPTTVQTSGKYRSGFRISDCMLTIC